jgi:nicotinamide mononucleotide transporter
MNVGLREWLTHQHVDLIQAAVLILGVTEVLLARVNSIWLYPAGITATVLSVYSLFYVQLYAECLLQFYYIVMSVYGWWYWMSGKNKEDIRVTFATGTEWLMTAIIIFGGWMLLFFFLKKFTPSTLPAWDAWVSSTGWAGMWLLARRKVENWIVLNLSNAFAIPLLFHKELPLFAFLTIFLFLVACKGYIDWVRIARQKVVVADRIS